MVSIATPTTMSSEVAPSSSELTPVSVRRDERQDRDSAQKQRPDQRDPVERPHQVLLRVLSRSHSGNERALALQILGDLLLLKDHHRVEVGERHHQQEVDDVVLQRVRAHELRQ